MPVLTAKTAPKAFKRRTGRERKEGIEKPERMVFISGIPEPEDRYMILPAAGVVGVATAVGLEDGVSEAVGKEDFVSIVALELMIPKTSAMATYIPNAEV
jgi:hypothetical protein